MAESSASGTRGDAWAGARTSASESPKRDVSADLVASLATHPHLLSATHRATRHVFGVRSGCCSPCALLLLAAC